MGKQTEIKNSKNSKKNYSFTGHRIIGENKSSYVNSNTASESSESNTTEEMMRILESEVKPRNMNQMGMNMNQMAPNMNQMNQMMMPGMGMNMNQMAPNMAMNQMMMPGMGMNMMGAQPKMEDIDPLMVNTLAPISNASMNMDANSLMTPMQMANNMGSLANLSKLSNVGSYGNNMMGTEMNLTEQNPASQLSNTNPMNQQLMGMLNNGMGMNNNMGNQGSFSLKNLAKLH
jgi:hypothetical protein